jgi:hypothetical protein
MTKDYINFFHSKALQNLPNFGFFWFENVPSGNPDPRKSMAGGQFAKPVSVEWSGLQLYSKARINIYCAVLLERKALQLHIQLFFLVLKIYCPLCTLAGFNLKTHNSASGDDTTRPRRPRAAFQ